MEISEEVLLSLVEAVKKLMVKNLRMEEYIRSLPRSMSRAQLKVAGGGWVDDTTLQLAQRQAERR
jgi:hypothetical protein